MLTILVKKQLSEIFRGYLYNEKKKEMRSKGQVAAFMVMFAFLMIVILGGVFAGLSILICPQLIELDLGWLYYCLMAMIALALGTFGCVFNTVSILYKAKDNDLMLSLPIPANVLMASRMMTTYLMGLMYSAVVYIPAMIVYFCFADMNLMKVVGGLLLGLLISLIVFILSCFLGMVVAKISLKTKKKSFVVVILWLVFIAFYYFVVMRFNILIKSFVANAMNYGAVIKGKLYPIYMFGNIGEGKLISMVVITFVVALVMAFVWRLMEKSYIKIAISTGKMEKKKYKREETTARRPFTALYIKEVRRFISSANYMLNCGLGIILMPVAGILMLIKGGMICELSMDIFGSAELLTVVLTGGICSTAAMNDMTAPSVSLEGRNIWILQSMPVKPWDVLKAKLTLQLSLTCLPVLFCSLCVDMILRFYIEPLGLLMVIIMPQLYVIFSAAFGLTMNLIAPNLEWSTEIKPIKQSLGVTTAIFGGWIYAIAMMGAYILMRNRIDASSYLIIVSIVTACLAIALLRWIRVKGCGIFAAL